MSKTVKEALKDGLVYFLAYGQFKKGGLRHSMLGKCKFICEDESAELLYMYEYEKGMARVLPPNGVGKNIKVEVYTMEEKSLRDLQKKLALDSCSTTTKSGIIGYLLIDQPFHNGISLQRGSIYDC